MTADRGRRLIVLQSFGKPTETSNPYLAQLVDSLSGRVDVRFFSWSVALTGRYDVFHVHWPERIVRGKSASSSLARLALFMVTLLIMRLRGRVLVRTVHNEQPHERASFIDALALRLCDRCTSLRILLNDAGAAPNGPSVMIRHGHYRTWLAGVHAPPVDQVPGRLLFFGLIRRYKGVDTLLDAFAELDVGSATLDLLGRVVDAQTGARIRSAAAQVPNITARLGFIPDSELVAAIRASQLVVLPYRAMNNSGAALLALSLDRPVLVPDTPATQSLADELGDQWVVRYSGNLDAPTLRNALQLTRDQAGERPDLGARDWAKAGADHERAYRMALSTAGRHDVAPSAGADSRA